MAVEIERKFLVVGKPWVNRPGRSLRQGYLTTDPECTVRVRLAEDKGVLTIKGKSTGCSRLEFEWDIPAAEAAELLESLCRKPFIEKQRYEVCHEGHTWEIDVFEGENAGLVIAEIELEDAKEVFETPAWLGREVTEDKRYYNASLVNAPYSSWPGNA
ncbi:MAG: CYTH domain-containing protein [Desulfuromonadales bacterium]|jgi:adenylate cyclase